MNYPWHRFIQAAHNVWQQFNRVHLSHQLQGLLPMTTAGASADAGAVGDEICLQHLLSDFTND